MTHRHVCYKHLALLQIFLIKYKYWSSKLFVLFVYLLGTFEWFFRFYSHNCFHVFYLHFYNSFLKTLWRFLVCGESVHVLFCSCIKCFFLFNRKYRTTSVFRIYKFIVKVKKCASQCFDKSEKPIRVKFNRWLLLK